MADLLPRARARAGLAATALAAGFAILAALAAILPASASEVDEIRVFSANGVKEIMADLVPRFESATGHQLIITRAGPGELKRRIIEGGEGFDVAFLPAQTLRDLATLNKVAATSMADIARSDIGLAIRQGAAKPDTSSPEAFKKTLLGAATIAVTDPASGGVTSTFFMSLLKRLGIADEIAPRLRLTKDVSNAELVARGENEMAVELAHEVHAVSGVEFVPFPSDFQRGIVFAAGIATGARDAAAAKQLIAFLSGTAGAQIVIAKGMKPAN